jgi:hypothetical protein
MGTRFKSIPVRSVAASLLPKVPIGCAPWHISVSRVIFGE